MQIDLSLVVYRPNRKLLVQTLISIGLIRKEYRLVRILVSGSNEDRFLVEDAIRSAELSDCVALVHRYDNLGFAAGHNYILALAFDSGADAVLIVNPDMNIDPGAVSALRAAAQKGNRPALYGPIIRRVVDFTAPAEIDSAGIVWTATGRHFDDLQGTPDIQADQSQIVTQGLTGACLLVPRDTHAQIVASTGYFFDDLFVAYREDAELGIRASRLGIPNICLNIAGFFHVRSVRGAARGNVLADLLGVRNRFIMKMRMGRHRPGVWIIAEIRDLLVILATLAQERSSLPGLLFARKTRRYIKYTSPYRTFTAGIN